MTAYRIDITSVVTMTDDQFYRLSQTGKAFDSPTGFKLPNGANRSPDVAWIRNDRWTALTPEQQQKFPPICPDFVIEIRSPSDDLPSRQEKMRDISTMGLNSVG